MERDTKNDISSQRIFPLWVWVLAALFIMTAFWVLRNLQVERMIKKQNHSVSEIIIENLKYHAENNLFLPEAYKLTLDSVTLKQLNDSIFTNLQSLLTKKLIADGSIQDQTYNLKPYYILPKKMDEYGNYVLTEHQMEELRQNILYLSQQVEKAVFETKREIGHDIERLNFWVTIWIGVIGFLGIFIPILANLLSVRHIEKEIDNAKTDIYRTEQKIDKAKPTLEKVDDLEKKVSNLEENINAAIKESNDAKDQAKTAKSESDNALKSANDAQKKVDDAKPTLSKVDDLAVKITSIEDNIALAQSDSAKAKEDASDAMLRVNEVHKKSEEVEKDAKTIHNLLAATHTIGKLKNFEPGRFFYIKDHFAYLIKILESIHNTFQTCNNDFDHNILKDSFGELAVGLYSLLKFNFIHSKSTGLIAEFVESINQSFEGDWTIDKYSENVSKLKQLIEELKA
jgi:myosin heavy subunit